MPGFELIGTEERNAVNEIFDEKSLFYNGKRVKSFERQFADYIGVNYAVAVSSGTAAIKTALVAAGIKPGDEVITQTFTFIATVEAIVAQRLVRRICNGCKEEYKPTSEELLELKMRPEEVADRTFFRGKGCDTCNNSGYRGRLALFEIMEFDDSLRELVLAQASTSVLRVEAQKRGMRSLRESGLLSIYDGQTTIDEVVRETMLDD